MSRESARRKAGRNRPDLQCAKSLPGIGLTLMICLSAAAGDTAFDAPGNFNPILATNSDRTVHRPGHHSILKHGDEDYIVYHRHDIPVTPYLWLSSNSDLAAAAILFEQPLGPSSGNCDFFLSSIFLSDMSMIIGECRLD